MAEHEPIKPEAGQPPPAPPPIRWLVWLQRLATACFCTAGISCLVLAGVLRHYAQNLPSTLELQHYAPPQITRILARDGSLLAEVFVERRTLVGIDAMPKPLKLAVLAAEDAEFYHHEGLDYLSMLRALLVNVRHGEKRQGGSTITQQVVKNALLDSERTFERKARELLLARRIEQELGKDAILELYLNHIYFGHGRYGVEEASRYYFGKSVGKLTLAEAAMIAGLPKGPAIFSPRVDLERSRRRRDLVLEQMAQKGFATRELVEKAKVEAIVLAPTVEQLPELAPEVVDEVQRVLTSLVGRDAARGGFTVTTTIDPERQAAARAAVRKNLDAFAARHGLIGPLEPKKKLDAPFIGTPKTDGHPVYNAAVSGGDDSAGTLTLRVGTAQGTAKLTHRYDPKGLKPSRFAPRDTLLRVSPNAERGVDENGVPHEYRLELGPQSALVMLDVESREIVALVGSYEGVRGTFDRASHAKRQPGSTFKPFVYGTGLRQRQLTAATVIPLPDRLNPNRLLAVLGKDPKDLEGATKPPVFLRDALARSINEAALWSLHAVGAAKVVAFATEVGLHSETRPTDSLALGAYETTPRDLASAYLTFASGGIAGDAVLIRSITGPNGQPIALPERPSPRRVLTEAESYLITNLLTSVVLRGTARAAKTLGLPLAGKTGTSNDSKDAWFAGYSPTTVCVVWTGYDDSVPLGASEQGATAALPAFIDAMRSAHHGRATPPWREPAGIVHGKVDPRTGMLAGKDAADAFDEVFLAGTEPTEASPALVADAGGQGGGGAPAADVVSDAMPAQGAGGAAANGSGSHSEPSPSSASDRPSGASDSPSSASDSPSPSERSEPSEPRNP